MKRMDGHAFIFIVHQSEIDIRLCYVDMILKIYYALLIQLYKKCSMCNTSGKQQFLAAPEAIPRSTSSKQQFLAYTIVTNTSIYIDCVRAYLSVLYSASR